MEGKSPIGSLLSQLREFDTKNKEVVDNLLQEAQKLFGLEDALDVDSLDALLIQAIMYHVFGSKGEPAQIDKAHAVKRDIYLLALGLLDGYSHIKDDGSYYTASERHKQYLTDSDYLKLSKFKPSDNLDINYAQSAPRRRLSTADKRCRDGLESLLSDKKKCQKFLEKGKEKYIKKSENGEKSIALPKPCCISGDSQPKPDVIGGSTSKNKAGRKKIISKTISQTLIHIINIIEKQINSKSKSKNKNISKKEKYQKWRRRSIRFVVILYIMLGLLYVFKLRIDFSVDKQLTVGSNQYQAEDPFSPQRLDFNLDIKFNASLSVGIGNKNDPAINDEPIPEPIETAP